jgi:hypothetical protein
VSLRIKRPYLREFMITFGVAFALCTIVPLLLVVTWAYSQYAVGVSSNFVVHVVHWVFGAALIALATATIATIIRQKTK